MINLKSMKIRENAVLSICFTIFGIDVRLHENK